MDATTIAVIGAGRIGTMHAENLVRSVPGALVKAVVSPRIDRDWADSLGIPVRTNEAEDVFQDREIEAVVIAAPSGAHVDLILRAAASGKHIFCEKPVAFDAGTITRAVDAVARAGVTIQVGFNRRFDPGVVRMWDAVKTGTVGEVHSLRVTNRDPKAPPIDFVRRSGGLFFDFAIHDFDTVRFLSGSEIVELFAAGAVLVDPEIGRAGDIDTAVVTLRLGTGALAVIDCSREAKYGYDQRFEVFGSKGSVALDNTTPTRVISSSTAGVVTDRPHGNFVERYRDAFIAELAAFVSSIRGGPPVRVGLEDALAAVCAADAARTSLQTHRPVVLADGTRETRGGLAP